MAPQHGMQVQIFALSDSITIHKAPQTLSGFPHRAGLLNPGVRSNDKHKPSHRTDAFSAAQGAAARFTCGL